MLLELQQLNAVTTALWITNLQLQDLLEKSKIVWFKTVFQIALLLRGFCKTELKDIYSCRYDAYNDTAVFIIKQSSQQLIKIVAINKTSIN